MNEHLRFETVEQNDKSEMGNITFNNSSGFSNKTHVLIKDEVSMDQHLVVETVEQHEERRKGKRCFNNSNDFCNKTCDLRELSNDLVCSLLVHVEIFLNSIK